MLDEFFLRAAIAALGLSLAAAPLGCLVVWRRMAYFGDATAHSALLGVAIALALSLPLFALVVVVAFAMAVAVAALSRTGASTDTALGVMSHGSLALGLLAVSLVPGARIDLAAFLTGDILSVGWGDAALIWAMSAAIWAAGAAFGRRVVIASLDEDLARAEGIDPRRIDLAIYVALAVFIAIGLKIVGVLLIAAMMIIPAAAARPLARSPFGMVAGAASIAAASTVIGLMLSWWLDTSTGPTIVSVAFAAFALAEIAARRL